jgi:CRP-like cAMP-binding protein
MPIVAITAYVLRANRDAIYSAGADAILAKPLAGIENFGIAIANVLKRQAGTPHSVGAHAAASPVALDRACFDRLIETAGPDDVSPLVRRLSTNVLLSEDEVDFMEGLQTNVVALSPGEEMIRDGDELSTTFLIRKGWVLRYRITAAGRRQILGISLPGDFIGLQVNFHRRAIATVSALTDTEVAMIEPLRILKVYQEYPVLAAGLEWMTVHNYNILSEHNVSLGARPAKERILHFFLELWCRLMQIGEASEDGFRMPLTQQQIADAMGLSQVHTNKSIRKLEHEDLIRSKSRTIVFPDADRAFEVADFDGRFLDHFRLRRMGNDPGRLVRRLATQD